MLRSFGRDLEPKEIVIYTPSLTVSPIGERLTEWASSGVVGGYIQPNITELTDRLGVSTGLSTHRAFTYVADIRIGYRLTLGAKVYEVLTVKEFSAHMELDLRIVL